MSLSLEREMALILHLHSSCTNKEPIIMNIKPIQIVNMSSMVNDVVLQNILNNSYGSIGNELDKITIHVNTPKITQPSLG